MSRPPRARELVLDAFSALLREEGERAATLEATARRAGVSKGGLLYHFGSRDALEAGLIERMHLLVAEDLEKMASADGGPVRYFLATSALVGDGLDVVLTAVSRLAGGGSSSATAALAAVREKWAEAVRPHVRDAACVDLVLLLGDGLYLNTAQLNDVPGPVPTGAALDRLLDLVTTATAAAPDNSSA